MRSFYISRDEKVNEVNIFDRYPEYKSGIFVPSEKGDFSAELPRDQYREDEIPAGTCHKYYLFRADECDELHPPMIKHAADKLFAKGFKILRRCDTVINILVPETRGWKKLSEFNTKAAAIRGMQLYLTDPLTLEM